jgi:hypothetical protein
MVVPGLPALARRGEGAPHRGQGASLSNLAELQNVQSIVVHPPLFDDSYSCIVYWYEFTVTLIYRYGQMLHEAIG